MAERVGTLEASSSQACLLGGAGAEVSFRVSEKLPSSRQPQLQQVLLVSHQLDVGPLSRLLSNGLAGIGRFPPGSMPLSRESAFCPQEHDPFLPACCCVSALLSLVLGSFLQPRWSSGAVEGNGHALAFQFQFRLCKFLTFLSRLRRLAGLSLRSASVLLAHVHQSSNMQIKSQEFEIKEVELADNEASHRASVPAFPVSDGILLAITSLHYMLISFQILAFWQRVGFQ